jgi:hypothetical protein
METQPPSNLARTVPHGRTPSSTTVICPPAKATDVTTTGRTGQTARTTATAAAALLRRRGWQMAIEPTVHHIIEAPWLANGGHGASVRQPFGPPPWLARRRPPAGKPKTDHDIHSLPAASSDTLCAGVRRRLWPARVRGDSQSQRPPAYLPLCRMAGSALAELIAGPCRTTVLISTR